MPNQKQTPTVIQPTDIFQPTMAAVVSLALEHISQLPVERRNAAVGVGLIAVGLALLCTAPR